MYRSGERHEAVYHRRVEWASVFRTLGVEALRMEWEFNNARFAEMDDEFPEFSFAEALLPTEKVARHRSSDVSDCLRELIA